MAVDMPCFARLPFELCDEILILAAWAASEEDKPWLCALATTSRRTLFITRPILYHTVCVTTSNLARVLATSRSGHSSRLTRHLWIGVHLREWEGREIRARFHNARHVEASFAFLVYPYFTDDSCLAIATLCTRLGNADWRLLSATHAALRHLTHLRLTVDSSDANLRYPLPPAPHRHPATALQYVVLLSSTHAWNQPRLFGAILPFFLSGPRVRRVLVCAPASAAHRPSLYAAAGEVRPCAQRAPALGAPCPDGR